MDATRLDTIAKWSNGEFATGDPSATVDTVCSDTRAIKPGDLFVALRGDKFDAHSFVAEAAARGAIAAMVDRLPKGLPEGFGAIVVDDTLRGLQNLSMAYRRSLSMQVIGVTGSNGKTSTKDLTAAVLGQHYQLSKTEGNYNNHVGVPLTLLRARGRDQFGIVEMGMNHAGEIAPLAAMAAPDAAIITNIGIAHIEYLGSRDAISVEKGMLAEALNPSGSLILNADDEYSEAIASRTKADAIYVGIGHGDVYATELRPHFAGTQFKLHSHGRTASAELPIPGEHMVRNSLLAVAAGLLYGLSLEECAEGLSKIQLTKGRLEQKVIRGIQILDDTYNANPDSVSAALRTLAAMPAAGRRIAVLGRMGELGKESESGHRWVGEVAAEQHIDCLVGVGEEAGLIADTASKGGIPKVIKTASTEEATEILRELARPGDIVLIKGSRSAKMENIVEGLHGA